MFQPYRVYKHVQAAGQYHACNLRAPIEVRGVRNLIYTVVSTACIQRRDVHELGYNSTKASEDMVVCARLKPFST